MEGPILRTVKTFDGTPAFKGHCKYIRGEYYELNRQCFLMPDGRWHRINNGLIVFEHKFKQWVFKDDMSLTYGVIGGNKDNVELGFFIRDDNDLVCFIKGRKYYLLNEDLVYFLDLTEDITTGCFYQKSQLGVTTNHFGTKKVYNYPIKLEYSTDKTLNKNIKDFNKNCLKGKINFFDEELDGITYGFEIETWNGTVNMRHLNKLGLIPLLDGSLRHDGIVGYEYATIPLSGAFGLYTIKNTMDVMQRYTEISKYCSLHLHIGGYKKSKEFVLSTYAVIKKLEDELYSLFPAYYEDTSNFKSKNYCGKLPHFNFSKDTDSAFNLFYSHMSGGTCNFDGFTTENHPLDPGANHKWDINTRYFNTNFVPFLWGKKGTIEFRLHPPTLSSVKAINWLFICNAILRYANLAKKDWFETYKSNSLEFKEVFSAVYPPQLAKYLNSYIETLKYNRVTYDAINDYEGNAWCQNDLLFNFPAQKMLTDNFEKCPLI